jgi:hypothetical protein
MLFPSAATLGRDVRFEIGGTLLAREVGEVEARGDPENACVSGGA